MREDIKTSIIFVPSNIGVELYRATVNHGLICRPVKAKSVHQETRSSRQGGAKASRQTSMK